MIKNLVDIFRQMGPRYVAFRGAHEIRKRSGLLKRAFPTSFAPAAAPELDAWIREKPAFLVSARKDIRVKKRPEPALRAWYERFLGGEFQYFNYEWKRIGRDYDWRTNPTTDYRYSLEHWTEIPDLDPANGDVKYAWEKSRFSYLLQLIRYDYHFEENLGELVFSEIDGWLDANPLNLGPNYICSQEISLRLLNWLFALYYYQDDAALTRVRWGRITQSIYGQLRHVRANIHFSRIAVRNNHAITETLMLYAGGLLFPSFPEAAEWKRSGKAWFEQEVAYQVYEDGTFIQFSHNYQRVLTQLLSYGLTIAGANGETFTPVVYERAAANLNYLFQVSEPTCGKLPNYGANDGALFFPLATQTYRDYRPQLNGLSFLLYGRPLFADAGEEAEWLQQAAGPPVFPNRTPPKLEAVNVFSNGGIYTFREGPLFVFFHCGSYRDRPSHADNLHLDLWYGERNLLMDDGSYRYNPEPEYRGLFGHTASHNTVTLGAHQQMRKGPRFIWFDWSRAEAAAIRATDNGFTFEGTLAAFTFLDPSVRHHRKVSYDRDKQQLKVTDRIIGVETGEPLVQHWHLDKTGGPRITATDNGQPLSGLREEGFYSPHYGHLVENLHLRFVTKNRQVTTIINLPSVKTAKPQSGI